MITQGTNIGFTCGQGRAIGSRRLRLCGRDRMGKGWQQAGIRPALTLLLLAAAIGPAQGQSYCSQIAKLVDSPANVRSLPTKHSAVICQLKPLGRLIRIYPVLPRNWMREYAWLATLACHGNGSEARIGLGTRPNYIHRSQLRVVAVDPQDWPSDRLAVPGRMPLRTYQELWQPYGLVSQPKS